MDTPNPLAHGNRLQRAYYRWALPYYDRFGHQDPMLRERVELVDVYLYSRRGLGAWAAWLLCLFGGAAWLHGGGMGLAPALGVPTLIMVGLSIALLGVWLRPQQKPTRIVGGLIGGALLGSVSVLVAVSFGWGMQGKSLGLSIALQALSASAGTLIPLGLSFALLLVGVARAGRAARESQLARLQLVAERDAAARAAAEADLRLLQAQIRPHFVFNTLATLQHWVDRRDERAGPLLRELTGFLRRSTELLGRNTAPLADEVQAVRHYLAILSARLQGRVQGEVHVALGLETEPLPPGMLLTLVENAVQHGLEPKIGDGRLRVEAGREPNGRWWLRVDNDGLGLAPDVADDVGLANLRQRLRHHFGERARFMLQARAEGGTRAEILMAP
ncbi:sensor histidine kinase [Roseateles sp. DC23W]|uniref:Sensor histidine kinase n=1 Tax=Pelomonas dachongensis TaxID=3299029 RepID=A0ABW7EI13_9BURK